jgi:hypothetical protein
MGLARAGGCLRRRDEQGRGACGDSRERGEKQRQLPHKKELPSRLRGRPPGPKAASLGRLVFASHGDVTRCPGAKPPFFTAPLEFRLVMLLGHGGTAGLILELVPLALVVAIGIPVWRRSRGHSAESASRDEAGVEQ